MSLKKNPNSETVIDPCTIRFRECSVDVRDIQVKVRRTHRKIKGQRLFLLRCRTVLNKRELNVSKWSSPPFYLKTKAFDGRTLCFNTWFIFPEHLLVLTRLTASKTNWTFFFCNLKIWPKKDSSSYFNSSKYIDHLFNLATTDIESEPWNPEHCANQVSSPGIYWNN